MPHKTTAKWPLVTHNNSVHVMY